MICVQNCYLKDSCMKYKRGSCNIGDDFCIKLFKIDSLYNLSLMSEQQRKYTSLRIDADGTDREQFLQLKNIEDDIVNFVNQGRNLYLYSQNCGNGKTSWALRFCQRYIQSIWYNTEIKCRVLFISVPKFFIMLKDNISHENDYIKHIKENVVDCDLVVWDDIGTKVGTEFEVENLLNIVNNRIDNGKSNIYTSNMIPKQLNERVGERLYSRIVNLSSNVELHGMDKRGL